MKTHVRIIVAFAFLGALFAAPLALAQKSQNDDLMPGDQAQPAPADKNSPEKPPKPQFELAKNLDGLFSQLKRTNDRRRADQIAEAIWGKWQTSNSKSVDLLTGWARDAAQQKNFAVALDLVDQVIVLYPKYAEGYNQRATIHYLMDNYGKSIVDIEQTLALEPRHFGALSGLAIMLEQIDKKQQALSAWKRALSVYPAMKNAQDSVIRLEEELAGSEI